MLRRMALRDFVIVRELDLDFLSGFTALTGETGAGKSILIDALQLALGARADSAVVREGAVRADIAVEFDSNARVHQWLEEAGFEMGATKASSDIDGSDSLLLRRLIDAQGKSRAWINGSLATAGQLRELGDLLLDIHGQHAWQSLSRNAAVRELLDEYAGCNSRHLSTLWAAWRSAQRALQAARAAQDQGLRERERLTWQIAEVGKLAPAAHEWEALNAQHRRLAHAQSLLQAAQTATVALQGNGDESLGALNLMHQADQALHGFEDIEPEFVGLRSLLGSAQAQIEDVVHSLKATLQKVDLDPERLQTLDDRLSLWLSLARRFKCPPEELAALWLHWQNELTAWNAANDLEQLEHQVHQAHAAYLQEAQQLSAARQQAAPALSLAVSAAMQELGMGGGRFEVSLQTLDQPQAAGLEDVAFGVAAHANSSPKPLAKVASGGELSRLALAIAVCTRLKNQSDGHVPSTLIFDEVDSGIGGAVAETVGRLMRQLGRHTQVLAVTHLPQVAAGADHQLRVSKHSDATHVHSQVRAIEGAEREAEIARMLGGEHITATTLAHAREMLSQFGAET